MWQWACIQCIFGLCRHFVCTGNVKKNLPMTVHPLLYADCTFKKCPALMQALVDLHNACWESQTVPAAWKQGVICLIPKQSASINPAELGNFRPIALTSCVGKIFTSILKDQWLQYMIANRYQDTNIQKAFVRNIPGCTEQYRKLLGTVSEAFRRHRSITVCWLDLANAYSSVNHGLINFTLQHYHESSRFKKTVSNLYSELYRSRVCVFNALFLSTTAS